jgi:hypothetical protein
VAADVDTCVKNGLGFRVLANRKKRPSAMLAYLAAVPRGLRRWTTAIIDRTPRGPGQKTVAHKAVLFAALKAAKVERIVCVATKLSETRSVPDAVKLYQECILQRVEI